MSKKFEYIIWDWNGTLLDDALTCVEAMNQCLQKRSLPLSTLESYRNLSCFPVINYYKLLGFDFDKESFEEVGAEFISIYNDLVKNTKLIEGTKEVLESYKNKRIKQYILTASQTHNVKIQLDFYGITNYFEEVIGINNIYATSKIEVGKSWLHKTNIPLENVIMFGDTTHDYETAAELGCAVVLIANGHQAKERLMGTGVPVIDSILGTRFFVI